MGPTRRALVKTFAGHLALLALLGRNGISPAGAATELFQPPEAFPEDFVVNLARERAKQPYVEAKVAMPDNWQSLTFDQYRDIRFDIEKSIWRGAPHGFSIDLLPYRFFYYDAGRYLCRGGRPAVAASITCPISSPSGRWCRSRRAISISIMRVSGCAIRSTGKDYFDEFAVFQGASYFRAIAKGQIYGLSARGLAIDTGQPQGEEFPFFRAFWIEEPPAAAATVRIHALLDSALGDGRLTASTSRPAKSTQMDVEVSIFPRRDLEHAGFAPLTSMYLFDELERASFDDYRPAVHDSDGLMMLTGAGEWIWRPLANPKTLQVSAFSTSTQRGFGLMQRKRRYGDFSILNRNMSAGRACGSSPSATGARARSSFMRSPRAWRSTTISSPSGGRARRSRKAPNSRFAYRLNWATNGRRSRQDNKAMVEVFRRRSQCPSGQARLFVIDFAGGNLTGDVVADVSASGRQDFQHCVTAEPASRRVAPDLRIRSGRRGTCRIQERSQAWRGADQRDMVVSVDEVLNLQGQPKIDAAGSAAGHAGAALRPLGARAARLPPDRRSLKHGSRGFSSSP